MTKQKILVFSFPGSGHVNPLIPILKELGKNENIEILYYLADSFKQQVESISPRIHYRCAIPTQLHEKLESQQRMVRGKSDTNLPQLITNQLEIADVQMDYLAKEIDKEKPDLIIYDVLTMYFKWTVEYYKKWYNIAQKTSPAQRATLKFCPSNPLPKLVCFTTTFSFEDNIYPNLFEKSMMVQLSFSFFLSLISVFIKQFIFCFKHGFNFCSPFVNLPMNKQKDAEFTFVSVFPELQPRSYLFDTKRTKYIGTPSVSDLVVDKRASQEPFRKILDSFPVLNTSIERFEVKNKLIYVSLGTVFNDNILIFEKIINAFKILNETPIESHDSIVRLKDLTIIISTGVKVYDQFEQRINSNQYSIPSNITLVKSAPQIDILRRASLFVTHSGMNSTNESIHFGVPMICIPISADQPLVAYRISYELGLGIMFDYEKMEKNDLKTGFCKVLTDQAYYERTQQFSFHSRKYKGDLNGAKLIIDLLNKKLS